MSLNAFVRVLIWQQNRKPRSASDSNPDLGLALELRPRSRPDSGRNSESKSVGIKVGKKLGPVPTPFRYQVDLDSDFKSYS